MTLSGKVALVTGAGSGIGKATAVLFAQQGARVGVLSHTSDEIEQTVKEITAQGHEAIAITADVAREQDMQRAVQQLIERWGRLDIVFANAGINGVWAPIEEISVDEWMKTINTNLTGTFLTIKSAVPSLKKQGGSIIVTASVNGTRIFSNTGATAYSSTKAAQVAMTKMLAVELGRSKIRVNVICPGAVDTEINANTQQRDVEKVKIPAEFPEGSTPLADGESASSEQVAQLALFLASDVSSHISGTEIWIDGASSLLRG
ncbi:SDR family oxidoreductase [Ktedonobacter robiniae]|uniref:3-ketoacyl-ACP reductase n=1 Tax=Ktedonobacter robiniae TaxID=2778365 RepID=A0ABQ3UMV6_9CHLR|nr:SDR family NAD(P)-dependent oxidoreductase [Ktedonobacter robiniae]GHO54081.1 3-ketoacyl-ACP reductase [Ktedonobacter robiniae]